MPGYRPRKTEQVRCGRCDGWGIYDGFFGRRSCSKCDGAGFVTKLVPTRWEPNQPTPPPPRGGGGEATAR